MKNCKFSIINLKEKLNKMLETENTNAERVLELSQELDKLILEYYIQIFALLLPLKD